MAKRVKSLRGAPPHVKKFWGGTGLEEALFRLVERGASWDEAHLRLRALYVRWFDAGCLQRNPLARLAELVRRERIREDAASGAFPLIVRVQEGREVVAVVYGQVSSSFVRRAIA